MNVPSVAVLVAVLVAAPVDAQVALAAPREAAFYRAELPHARPVDVPRRVVSLAPTITETLFLLGRGPSVVGVTRYCDRPAEAQALPKVGGYIDPSLEAILALKPDLVVAIPSFAQRGLLDRVRERGIPVLVGFSDTLAEVKDLTRALGEATGAKQRSATLLAELERRLRNVHDASLSLPPVDAVVVVGTEHPMVAGPGTFADEALRLVHARSVVPADGPAWPTWSIETLLAKKPRVIVAAEGPKAAARLRTLVSRRAGTQIEVVSGPGHLLMRPGPSLASDVEVLLRLLGPGVRTPPAARRTE